MAWSQALCSRPFPPFQSVFEAGIVSGTVSLQGHPEQPQRACPLTSDKETDTNDQGLAFVSNLRWLLQLTLSPPAVSGQQPWGAQ